jgi:hypothetical protein
MIFWCAKDDFSIVKLSQGLPGGGHIAARTNRIRSYVAATDDLRAPSLAGVPTMTLGSFKRPCGRSLRVETERTLFY